MSLLHFINKTCRVSLLFRMAGVISRLILLWRVDVSVVKNSAITNTNCIGTGYRVKKGHWIRSGVFVDKDTTNRPYHLRGKTVL